MQIKNNYQPSSPITRISVVDVHIDKIIYFDRNLSVYDQPVYLKLSEDILLGFWLDNQKNPWYTTLSTSSYCFISDIKANLSLELS